MRSTSLRAFASRPAVRALEWLACACFALACVAGNAGAAPAATTDPAQRLREIERMGRTEPAQAAAALAGLLDEGGIDAATRLSALSVQAGMFAWARNEEAAEAVARQLDELGRSQAQPLATAAALLARAQLAHWRGDMRRADTLIGEAMAHLPAAAPPLRRLSFVSAEASIFPDAGRLVDAIRAGHEALTLADAVAEPWRRAEIRVTLAFSYLKAKQFEQAVRVNAEAMAIAEREGDPLTLARVHGMEGIIRGDMGDIEKQRHALYAALAFARAAHAKTTETVSLANVAEFHLDNGEYALALRYAQEVLPRARAMKSRAGEVDTLGKIGLAQIALHDVEAGKRNLRAAIELAEQGGLILDALETYGEMGKYLEKAGDLGGAIDALHRHRTLSDQVLQRSQQQAILEMQEKYDNERRTRELDLLQRDGAIKSEQLRARELQQRAWSLLAAACTLSLAVVAWLARRLRVTNHRLADSNALLKTHSEIDPLTGLANRRSFLAAIRQLTENGPLSGTVLLVDVDHFKRINDRWGHATGDAVLVELARRLRATLREGDLIVRWGGEEFLILARALAPAAGEALAQTIVDAVGATPVRHEGHAISATVSLGFASFPLAPAQLAVAWPRAVKLVDAAMYLAKARGRNRACGVSLVHAKDEALLDALSAALEAACAAGELRLTELPGRASANDPVLAQLAEAA